MAAVLMVGKLILGYATDTQHVADVSILRKLVRLTFAVTDLQTQKYTSDYSTLRRSPRI